MTHRTPFGLLALLSTSTIAHARDLTADAGGPYSVDAGSTATLDASGTTYDAGECSAPEYRWDLDGAGGYDTAWSTSATTTFDAAGLDGPDSVGVSVQARSVCEGDTKTDTDSATITINNVPPAITAVDGPATARVDAVTSWTVTYTDVEPADTHSVRWDWGDSSADGGATADHAWATPGVYTVTVTVTDDDGGSDSLSVDIEVTEEPTTGDTGGTGGGDTGGTGGGDTGTGGGGTGSGGDTGGGGAGSGDSTGGGDTGTTSGGGSTGGGDTGTTGGGGTDGGGSTGGGGTGGGDTGTTSGGGSPDGGASSDTNGRDPGDTGSVDGSADGAVAPEWDIQGEGCACSGAGARPHTRLLALISFLGLVLSRRRRRGAAG